MPTQKRSRMRPLTPRGRKAEENLSKTFCATLPSNREIAIVSKSFCATLPGELDADELTKAFCATLPSEAQVRTKLQKTPVRAAKK